jgi:hypothetical protein
MNSKLLLEIKLILDYCYLSSDQNLLIMAHVTKKPWIGNKQYADEQVLEVMGGMLPPWIEKAR